MGSPLPVTPLANVLTPERFAKLFRHAHGRAGESRAEILDALLEFLPKYGLTAPADVAMFLAQVGHESLGFTRWEESLNYSVERLLVVFPRYFKTVAEATTAVAAGHEFIACKVYGGRMGNAPWPSLDGYVYRARGPIGLTGLDNYRKYGKRIGAPLHTIPGLAGEVRQGVHVACAFYADNVPLTASLERATRAINGGLTGIQDRTARWLLARQALGLEGEGQR